MRPHSGNSIENCNPIIVNPIGKNCDPIQRHLFISLLLGSTPRLKKLQASEMRCFRKLLGISYRDHITNDAVRDRIRQAVGPYDDILTMVKKRKLKSFGHVSRSAGLTKTILQGAVQGGRRRGRQKKRWENNIFEWAGLRFCKALREAENQIKWRKRVAMSVAPQRSPRLRDRCKVQRSAWKTPCH